MREFSKRIFSRFFYMHLVKTRNELAMTQEQMAQLLDMAPRSFIELDHGKCTCSGLTLALYLTYCCDDPRAFLNGFRREYEKEVLIEYETIRR